MEEGNGGDKMQRDAEMEEFQKEYQTLCSEEQDLLKKLKHHKDEDAIKGQAVKNQKALWDKALEFRFLMQKTFSLSNKLPRETVQSYFCNSDKVVDHAYSELISSSKHALSCILELQEALLENNPSITQGSGKGSCKDEELLSDLKREDDEEWSNICKLHHRISPFRNNSVDKWHRKTRVSTGAAVFRGKLNAFNQNINDQVDGYVRDPNRMITRMQLRRSQVGVWHLALSREFKYINRIEHSQVIFCVLGSKTVYSSPDHTIVWKLILLSDFEIFRRDYYSTPTACVSLAGRAYAFQFYIEFPKIPSARQN